MNKRPLGKRIGRALLSLAPTKARAAWEELAGTGRGNAYEGANINRLVMDWIIAARPADEELRGDIRRLRSRARELGRNNSYVKRYFRLLQNNVIGPMGIRLQAQVRIGEQADAATNRTIETAWNDWAASPVTTDGKLTLRRLEKLILKTMACDGEAFIRLRRGFEANRYGLALETIDADLIDETYNRPREGDMNEIRMGVELDAVGRPAGYWVWKTSTMSGVGLIRERYFVPASDMLHLYDPERVNQTRGATWVHAAMVPSHMLNAYEESEAVASRIAASNGGFLVRRPDASGGDLSSETKAAKMEVAPGVFQVVPDGYEPANFTPDHPTAQFPAFVKQLLRKIASGLQVFYNVLANDAEGVTYSTMRSFALIERDDWRSIQQDFIDMWRHPLYSAWLDMALLTGALALPARETPRYLAVRHRPRGWQWIDPENEANAAVISIENGLGTRTGFLAEKGEDIEDVFAELKHEEELAKAYGLKISGGSRPGTSTPTEPKQPPAAEGNGGNGKASAAIAERLLLSLAGKD